VDSRLTHELKDRSLRSRAEVSRLFRRVSTSRPWARLWWREYKRFHDAHNCWGHERYDPTQYDQRKWPSARTVRRQPLQRQSTGFIQVAPACGLEAS